MSGQEETLPASEEPMITAKPPTKEEIIQILKDENPPIDGDTRFNQLFFIIELKKVNEQFAIIKGELYSNDSINYRGSVLFPIGNLNYEQQGHWTTMKGGESTYYGISFDSREACLTERVKSFFARSIDEGKLQDLLPW